MKRPFSPTTLLAILLLVSFFGAIVITILGGQESVRSSVQLAIFPVVVLLLSALTLKGLRLPRMLVGLAAVGVLCGAIVRYSDVGLQEGVFAIAPFTSDTLENKTMIFRDNVRRFAGERSASIIGTIPARVSTEEEARWMLAQRPQLGGIIWGSERWIHVSSRLSPPVSLRQMPESSYARRRLKELGLSDLRLITQAPWVGLSKGLDVRTYEFVGRFAQASVMLSQRMTDFSVSSDLEHLLQRASSIQAAWTSSEHLAAPKIMLGTYYLARAISGHDVEWGDLRCALASYRSARLILKKRGNPALMAAIRNNEAVIKILISNLSADPAMEMRNARAGFQQAYATRKRSRLLALEPSYWDPIKANMKEWADERPKSKKRGRK
jgi:hypothetical protein